MPGSLLFCTLLAAGTVSSFRNLQIGRGALENLGAGAFALGAHGLGEAEAPREPQPSV